MDSRPLGRAGEGLFPISCFSTGASRTFFTANGGFFYRGHCWRHAPHDGGDGADAQEENLFSDRHWRHPHQGEAASSAHGFLCLFQPLPNPPQREGVPPNRLKHSKNGLPPLGEGRGGAPTSSCFCTGASRTFFTANGGFFYRGHCWRHAPHDGGDGGDETEENLFSDCQHHHHHQGEAASSAHGFLCLFQPHVEVSR